MTHELFRPSRALAPFVDCLWVSQDQHTGAPRERVLPTGALSLVVDVGEQGFTLFDGDDATTPLPLSRAVMCGARARPLVIGMTGSVSTVGVLFKPGGARPFLGAPAADLEDRVVPLDDLWGAPGRTLRERVLETDAPQERVAVLEAMLLQRARTFVAAPPIVRGALAAFDELDLTSVGEVGRRAGLSPKRLLALFRDEVGLGPKAYWRVRRFRAALRRLELRTSTGAALAADHGYFDQAHWNREFRALSGVSPREYFALRIEGTDHIAVRG